MAKRKGSKIGNDHELACDEFLKIAEHTGILTREIKIEPTQEERELLWDIT